jgi:hypothetical protein
MELIIIYVYIYPSSYFSLCGVKSHENFVFEQPLSSKYQMKIYTGKKPE